MKNWPLETEIPINWGDMDAFNHVNNIIFLRWCETARIELFRKIWGDVAINMVEILNKDGVGPILANFNINYKNPVSYPNSILIKTRVSKVGNSSFGVEHILYIKKKQPIIAAEASSIVVMVNYKSGDKFILDDQNKNMLYEFS